MLNTIGTAKVHRSFMVEFTFLQSCDHSNAAIRLHIAPKLCVLYCDQYKARLPNREMTSHLFTVVAAVQIKPLLATRKK